MAQGRFDFPNTPSEVERRQREEFGAFKAKMDFGTYLKLIDICTLSSTSSDPLVRTKAKICLEKLKG